MSELINQMAAVELPQEVLDQVEIGNIVAEFKRNFQRLDDFKKIRDEHNQRGSLKKIWDFFTLDSTLKDAQYDATEVQSSFNKSIGQLMALSIAQSQALTRQQQALLDQQGRIKQQTSRLEDQAIIIESQQADLSSQSIQLQDTLSKFIELKGFTQDELLKFVAIANDVKTVRDNMLRSVSESLSEMRVELNTKTDAAKNHIESIAEQISEVQEVNKHLSIEMTEKTEGLAKQVSLVALELRDAIYSVASASELRDESNNELAKNNLQELDFLLRSNDDNIQKMLIGMLEQQKAEQRIDLKKMRWSFGLMSLITLSWMAYLSLH